MKLRSDDRTTAGAIALVMLIVAAANLFIPPVTPADEATGLIFAVGAGVWLSLATRP